MSSRRAVIPLAIIVMCLFSIATLLGSTENAGAQLRSSIPVASGVSTAPRPRAQSVRGVQRIRMALFCLERSGSTWLTAMLNQNEGVRVAAEPLARLVSSGGAADELAAIKREVSALELGTDAQTGRGWTVSGFNEKLLSKRYGLPQDPVYFDKFRQYLIDQNFRVILLMRKNFVSQAISMIQAVKLSGSKHCGSHGWSRVNQKGWDDVCGQDYERIRRERISVSDLQNNLEDIRAKARDILTTMNRLNIPRLTVYYEDLVRHPEKVLRSISYWIGLNSSQILRPQDTIFIKQGFDNLTDIANYNEIRQFLKKFSPCMMRTVEESLQPGADLTMCI